MDISITPDQAIAVIGLAISIVSLAAFNRLGTKILTSTLFAFFILFAVQVWHLWEFESKVEKTKSAILGYLSDQTRTQWMIKKNLLGPFGSLEIGVAFDQLRAEGRVIRQYIEVLHKGPQGDVLFEMPVYCKKEGVGSTETLSCN